jgi:hypothetical protein
MPLSLLDTDMLSEVLKRRITGLTIEDWRQP